VGRQDTNLPNRGPFNDSQKVAGLFERVSNVGRSARPTHHAPSLRAAVPSYRLISIDTEQFRRRSYSLRSLSDRLQLIKIGGWAQARSLRGDYLAAVRRCQRRGSRSSREQKGCGRPQDKSRKNLSQHRRQVDFLFAPDRVSRTRLSYFFGFIDFARRDGEIGHLTIIDRAAQKTLRPETIFVGSQNKARSQR
jgi:hypothetical protein